MKGSAGGDCDSLARTQFRSVELGAFKGHLISSSVVVNLIIFVESFVYFNSK